MSIDLSIVIPAFNEAARLDGTLQEMLRYLNDGWAERAELILVDDGSTDKTVEVVKRRFTHAGSVSARLLRVELNRGKGHAVRKGLLAARGLVSLFSDADLSTPISETMKLVAPITAGECDVVFGSRALDRSLIGERQPWRREQGGRVFNRIVRLLTGLNYHDTQCGFKAFRSAACRPVFEAALIDRFGFDVELLYIAHAAGLRLREVPVRWLHCEGSKVDIMRDSLRMFNEVRMIRRQARRGDYDRAINSIKRETSSASGECHPIRHDHTGNLPHDEEEAELISKTAQA